jgi:hypothetical protein
MEGIRLKLVASIVVLGGAEESFLGANEGASFTMISCSKTGKVFIDDPSFCFCISTHQVLRMHRQ